VCVRRDCVEQCIMLSTSRVCGRVSYTSVLLQSDSLATSPTEVYLQIFNEFVNQLTDDELTTGYYQQVGATCHTSNASMRGIESFLKTELSQKTFGHPDLPMSRLPTSFFGAY